MHTLADHLPVSGCLVTAAVTAALHLLGLWSCEVWRMGAVRYSVRAEGSSEALLSSEEGGSVVLVGSGQPVKAFAAALKTMKQGEKASLKIKPECEASHSASLLTEAFDVDMLYREPGRGASLLHFTSRPAAGRLALRRSNCK